jgi:hypothetical protein
MATDFENGWNTKRAAAFLGLSGGSLAVMRSRKTGPPCTYSGAKPVYYRSQLEAWQEQCRRAHDRTCAGQADASGMETVENKGSER